MKTKTFFENWKLKIENFPHHALLVCGDPALADETYVIFDIADARELHRRASLAVGEGETQVFCIGAYGFGEQAQNALLKTIEEPIPGTRFLFITPYPDDLLPTLRSRLYIMSDGDLEAKTSDVKDAPTSDVKKPASKLETFDAVKFLAQTPIERLKYLEKNFFDLRDESDEVHARTKYDAGAILSALELYYAKNPKRVDAPSFELLERSKQYIHDTAPNVKLILESLALHLPMV